MPFDKKGFDSFILKNKVVGIKEQPFKLKSGRLSHWYANCRVLSDTAGIIDTTATYVISFLEEKGIKFDYVYGVPAGATKLADTINYKLGMKNPKQKMVIGREKPKEHGDPRDRYFIGPIEEGDKVIVLEDVTTTGGSLIGQINALNEAKVKVVAAIGLVNRLERRDDGLSVEEYIKKQFNVPYYWLTDAARLLPIVVKEGKLPDGLVKKVEENLRQYSAVAIRLK